MVNVNLHTGLHNVNEALWSCVRRVHYYTSSIHALPNAYVLGVLSEHFLGMLAGVQHSALSVVVA